VDDSRLLAPDRSGQVAEDTKQIPSSPFVEVHEAYATAFELGRERAGGIKGCDRNPVPVGRETSRKCHQLTLASAGIEVLGYEKNIGPGGQTAH
jgi:hypothetical protein